MRSGRAALIIEKAASAGVGAKQHDFKLELTATVLEAAVGEESAS
jgi:hypothetical protein